MRNTRSRNLAVLLGLSIASAVCWGQQTSPQPDARGTLPGLRVIVLAGQQVVNHIPTGSVTIPVVEIRDINARPVEGALVKFELPSSGPGGTFADGQSTYTTTTDYRGQAAASGFRINSIPGSFDIRVTASSGDFSGSAIIRQVNSIDRFSSAAPPPRSFWSRWGKWILIGGGGAAAAGIVASTTGGGSSTPQLSLSVGSIAVGGPR